MEFDLIDRIRQRTAASRDDVLLGIGDDAALLRVPSGQDLAAAVDTLVEGVHFPRGTSAADLGWKALAVNLSDLAAMGGTPAWALLSLTLPQADNAFVDAFAEGFAQLARPYRLALVGGDTTRGPLSVSVTVHGFVPSGAALCRRGARIGDAILVTGTLGDAAAGLCCLDHQHPRAGRLLEAPASTRETLIARLNRPQPRVRAGTLLRGRASACIDVSDGLLADLGHLCAASGVGAQIEAATLPQSSAMLTLFDEGQAREMALSGGDDYELCFTASPEHAADIGADLSRLGCAATRIGRITQEPGVRVRDVDGQVLAPAAHGWDHFHS